MIELTDNKYRISNIEYLNKLKVKNSKFSNCLKKYESRFLSFDFLKFRYCLEIRYLDLDILRRSFNAYN